jgi:hypothetical protein
MTTPRSSLPPSDGPERPPGHLPRPPYTLQVRGRTFDVHHGADLVKICMLLGRSPGWATAASTEEIADYLVTAERGRVRALGSAE